MTIKSIQPLYTRSEIAIATALSGALTTACVWGLYQMTWLNSVQGAGFGAVVKLVASVATPYMGSGLYQNSVLSHALGGVIAYGLSYTLASLGYVVIQITVLTAVILTVASLSITLLFPKNTVRHYDNGARFEGILRKDGTILTGTHYGISDGLPEEVHYSDGKQVWRRQYNKDMTLRQVESFVNTGPNVEKRISISYDYDGEKKVTGHYKREELTVGGEIVSQISWTYDANNQIKKVRGGAKYTDGVLRDGEFDHKGEKLINGLYTEKNGDTWDGTFDADENLIDGIHITKDALGEKTTFYVKGKAQP